MLMFGEVWAVWLGDDLQVQCGRREVCGDREKQGGMWF